MKQVFFLLSISFNSFLYAQYFEGKIVYNQVYQSRNPEISAEMLSDFVGDKHEYFISGAKYASLVNGAVRSNSFYNSRDGRIYKFYPNGDSLVISEASQQIPSLVDAYLIDDREKVLSWDCNAIRIKTSLSEITYFYSSKHKINSELFKDHKYGNWDAYTKLTGSLPLKYVMVFPEFTITGTAVSVEEMDLPDSFFEELIPKEKTR